MMQVYELHRHSCRRSALRKFFGGYVQMDKVGSPCVEVSFPPLSIIHHEFFLS